MNNTHCIYFLGEMRKISVLSVEKSALSGAIEIFLYMEIISYLNLGTKKERIGIQFALILLTF